MKVGSAGNGPPRRLRLGPRTHSLMSWDLAVRSNIRETNFLILFKSLIFDEAIAPGSMKLPKYPYG